MPHGPVDDGADLVDARQEMAAATGIGEGGPELLPPRGPFRIVMHWTGVAEQFLGASFVIVILVLVVLQVTQRYLPGGGWVWTGEIARFALVWATLVLSGYLMAHDRHISLQVIDYMLPPRGLHAVKVFASLIVAVTCLAMTYEAYQLISDRSGQVSPATRIPLTLVYIVPFAGFILTALRAAIGAVMIASTSPTPQEGDRLP